MRKFTAAAIAALLIMPLLGGRGLADEHREHWHGDIGRFHEHDLGFWRSGHWFHGNHEGRFGWWWIVDGGWYFYPAPIYPYPSPYVPPAVAIPGNPYSAPPAYWYYCPNPPGYYPYVPSCPYPWQPVPAAPPG